MIQLLIKLPFFFCCSLIILWVSKTPSVHIMVLVEWFGKVDHRQFLALCDLRLIEDGKWHVTPDGMRWSLQKSFWKNIRLMNEYRLGLWVAKLVTVRVIQLSSVSCKSKGYTLICICMQKRYICRDRKDNGVDFLYQFRKISINRFFRHLLLTGYVMCWHMVHFYQSLTKTIRTSLRAKIECLGSITL